MPTSATNTAVKTKVALRRADLGGLEPPVAPRGAEVLAVGGVVGVDARFGEGRLEVGFDRLRPRLRPAFFFGAVGGGAESGWSKAENRSTVGSGATGRAPAWAVPEEP